MKVILKADIKGVGKKNEVINASDGYARNFLFPKNLAVEANAENMSKLKAQNEATQFRKDTEKEDAKKVAEKLTKIMVRIEVKAGENGKIFGGVSAKYSSILFISSCLASSIVIFSNCAPARVICPPPPSFSSIT